MNFLEELEWRGMLFNSTPDVEEVLSKGMTTGYIGFDPTAPSLTLGNMVQIMVLKLFQLSGHKPIVLMGGATGRVGDPSGKDQERELLSYDILDSNLQYQAKLMSKFLDFDNGPNNAIMVNNYDFYKEMNVLDFLRKVGKTLTINYMMSKESVKKRIETGLSFTEFSYQLLQAYDFQCLYEQQNCLLQMGGSDQWGNITSGTEFIRRNVGGKAYAVTTPLLTKADGSKFGKSTKGNVWIDSTFTSPYAFYQFWIQADDRDIPKFIRYFTLKSREEVEAMEKEYEHNPRMLKQILGEELTRRVHSGEAYEAAFAVSQLLFNNRAKKDALMALSVDDLQVISDEIDHCYKVPQSVFSNGVNVVDLLAEQTSFLNSKGEARRAIKGNAVSVNKDKVTSHELTINHESLLFGKYLMMENGKKNKAMIVVS
ncbi:MAG: tyrosine--tRNA ligase [Bacteroidota bacterium]